MKILVTEGAGFIGSHVVEALISKGIEVHIIDNGVHQLEKQVEKVQDKKSAVETNKLFVLGTGLGTAPGTGPGTAPGTGPGTLGF